MADMRFSKLSTPSTVLIKNISHKIKVFHGQILIAYVWMLACLLIVTFIKIINDEKFVEKDKNNLKEPRPRVKLYT